MTRMVRVTLWLPAGLFRRFRHAAMELVVEDLGDYATRLDLLAACAAVEARLEGWLCEPPEVGEPLMAAYASVPALLADSIRELARVASLTPEQAWHRVVYGFCERIQSPWLESPAERKAA